MEKHRKKPVYIWDRCMRFMKLYTDDNPDIRQIKGKSCWITFLFPNGIHTHFRAIRRNSKSIIGTIHNTNAELELAMELCNEEDFTYLCSKLNKLVLP